jgi:hypothetical protein
MNSGGDVPVDWRGFSIKRNLCSHAMMLLLNDARLSRGWGLDGAEASLEQRELGACSFGERLSNPGCPLFLIPKMGVRVPVALRVVKASISDQTFTKLPPAEGGSLHPMPVRLWKAIILVGDPCQPSQG